MSDLNWEKDSKELFDKMMAVVPDEMKSMAEQMLLGMITQKAGGGAVTKQVLVDVVEVLPEPQKSVLKGVIDSSEEPAEGEIEWADERVEKLFERLVLAAPKEMRETFRGMFLSMLKSAAGGNPVTVELIKQLVEGSPEPQRSVLKGVLDAPEPADTEQIREIVETCGKGQENITKVLQKVMEVLGYLSYGTLLEVAQQTGVPASHIFHLATTQKIVAITPPAEHHLKICTGTGCYVRDEAAYIDDLERMATGKQNVFLEKIRCLGCCDCGPIAEVDGEKMTLEAVRTRIDNL